MPYNGSGTFDPLPPPDFPAVAGAPIIAAYFNAVINDILAQGLTRVLVRDGQSAMTGNLNFGGFRGTNLAAPSAGTDAARLDDLTTKLDEAGGTMTGVLELANNIQLQFVHNAGTSDAYFVLSAANLFQGVNSGGFEWLEVAAGATPTVSLLGNILSFFAAGIEQMRLTAAGNLGVGTTTAAERLTVSGNASVSGNVSAGGTIAATGAVSSSGIELGFRDLPVAGSLTRGQCFPTAAGVTLSAQTAGNLFTIYNNSAAPITLTESGITLRLSGTTLTGSRTLLARGFASVWYHTATEALVSGGVT